MFLFLGRDKEPDTEIVELVYIQFVSLRFQESSSFLQKKNKRPGIGILILTEKTMTGFYP